MLRIKDVSLGNDLEPNQKLCFHIIEYRLNKAIENEFYLLEERIKVKLLALEVCLDIDQTIIEYKSKTRGL